MGIAYWLYQYLQLHEREKEVRQQLEINRTYLDNYTKLLLQKSRMLVELQHRVIPEGPASQPAKPPEETAGALPNDPAHEKGPDPVLQDENEQSLNLPDDLSLLQQMQILTKDDWKTFLAMFEKAYPGYIQELNERLPMLTGAETRFILLSKLSLGRKEIASLLGVSPQAVKKTRQRLRKKLAQHGYAPNELFPE